MSKIIMIASGGLDSTVLYFDMRRNHDIKIVNFSYGSKHNSREREALRHNVPAGTHIQFIDLDLSYLKSSLTKKELNIPEGHYEEESMKSTVVPFRNGIMLSYAVAIADSERYNSVMFANHSGDHFIYPDCRPMFLNNMSAAAWYGTFNRVAILSPYISKSKAGIVGIGKELNITDIMFDTWTCYNGREKHCGKCGACTERKEAFALNHIADLTEYEK